MVVTEPFILLFHTPTGKDVTNTSCAIFVLLFIFGQSVCLLLHVPTALISFSNSRPQPPHPV